MQKRKLPIWLLLATKCVPESEFSFLQLHHQTLSSQRLLEADLVIWEATVSGGLMGRWLVGPLSLVVLALSLILAGSAFAWPPSPTPPSDPCDASGWDAYYQRLISDAVSIGDAYAATAAGQDMRAKSAWIQANCRASGGGSASNSGDASDGGSQGAAVPTPDMCEYRGVMMVCSEAWIQYQRDVQASQQGTAPGGGSSSPSIPAGPNAQSQSQPRPQSPSLSLPQDGSSPVEVPVDGALGSLLREMQAAGQGHDTWIEVYGAVLPIWSANAGTRGLQSEYEWVMRLFTLQVDEGDRKLRNWTNGEWVRRSSAAAASTIAQPSVGARSVTVSFERSGTQIQGLSLADNGKRLRFQIRSDLRQGSALTIEQREWSNERSRWISVIDRLNVGAKRVTSYSTQIGAWQYVVVRDKGGKALARIKIEG